MSSKLNLLDFEILFGSEPVWVHENGWFYGAHFVVERGIDRINLIVAPDEGEFSLEWPQDGRNLLRLRLVSVAEWHIQTKGGNEQLVAKSSGERESLCVVTISPAVCVSYEGLW